MYVADKPNDTILTKITFSSEKSSNSFPTPYLWALVLFLANVIVLEKKNQARTVTSKRILRR